MAKKIFAYVSDIHIETKIKYGKSAYQFIFDDLIILRQMYPNVEINLILAGDITKPRKSYSKPFFEKVTTHFENVFYVLGNHDHYKEDFFTIYQKIKDQYSYITNFHILDQAIYEFSDLTIIGATLWTDFNYDKNILSNAFNEMADYKQIKKKTNGLYSRLKAVDVKQKNYQDFNFIFNEIKNQKSNNKDVIVVTHHVPFITEYDYKKDTFYYKSNYNKKIMEYKPDYWIFGHDHYSYNTKIGSTFLFSNPIGYKGEYLPQKLKYFEWNKN